MNGDNIDIERVHACLRAAERAHALVMNATERAREAHAEEGRLTTARARCDEDIAKGRRATVHGDRATHDPVAEIDRSIARVRAEHARLVAETNELQEAWQARKRLADRVRAYALQHDTSGSFDAFLTPTFSDTARGAR